MTENHYASSEVISSYPFWHILASIAVNFSFIINGKSKDIVKRPLKSKTKECKFILELHNCQEFSEPVNLLFITCMFSSLPHQCICNTENFEKCILKADFEYCEHESDIIYMAEISLNNFEIIPP